MQASQGVVVLPTRQLGEASTELRPAQRLDNVLVADLDQRGPGLEVQGADGGKRRADQQVNAVAGQRRGPW